MGPTINESVKVDIVSGQPIEAPLKISDIGKSTAKNVEMEIYTEIVPANEAPMLRCVDHDIPCNRMTVIAGVIFANDDATFCAARPGHANNAYVATPADAQNWDNKSVYLAVYGIANYHDVFGVKHWLKFCDLLTKKDQGTASLINMPVFNMPPCVNFNSVDND